MLRLVEPSSGVPGERPSHSRICSSHQRTSRAAQRTARRHPLGAAHWTYMDVPCRLVPPARPPLQKAASCITSLASAVGWLSSAWNSAHGSLACICCFAAGWLDAPHTSPFPFRDRREAPCFVHAGTLTARSAFSSSSSSSLAGAAICRPSGPGPCSLTPCRNGAQPQLSPDTEHATSGDHL